MTEKTYRAYLLGVLFLLLAVNNSELLAFGLVLQQIKVDLSLSDTQLGLLTGMAFAAFYALMGVPLARWADRGNRITVISVTGALWSLMVALCGSVSSFAQLLLVRVGVAVGEPGCIPPSYSLIGDYFDRDLRPRAIAIFLMGGNISFGIGYFFAGKIDQLYGWRSTFQILGLLGLIPTALAWLTLKEPRREARAPRTSAELKDQAIELPPDSGKVSAGLLQEVWSTFRGSATLLHVLLSFSVATFFAQGVLQWLPSFFMRSFGLPIGETGLWFGLIWGIGGFLGTYLGGELASRFAPNNERLQLNAMAIAYCGFAIFSVGIYLAKSDVVALVFMALAVVGVAMTNGPLLAVLQTIVPPRMRATSVAVIYLFSNLIGMGLGPLAVGALSDALRPAFGEESLRYALITMSPGYLWSGWHLWRSSRTVNRDMERANASSRPLVPALRNPNAAADTV